MSTEAVAKARGEHGGKSAARETPGLIGGIVRLIFWLLVSLLFSVVIEWVGMTFWWFEEGTAHSRGMLADEIGYLSGDLRRTALVSDTAAYARAFADTSYEWLWQRTGLERAMRWAADLPDAQAAPALQRGIHSVYRTVADYVVAAATITQVFAVRVAILTLAMPAFGLTALVGAIDGLARRDLRRWGGGRESSFLYHHAKRLIWPIFILAWVVYLSLPFSLHPAIAVAPFAAGVGLLVAVTTSSFKKYL